MYPSGELEHLAQRKTIIRARIAIRRWQCALAVVELTKPLSQVDRGIAFWHRFSPLLKLLALPAGLIFGRMLGRRGVKKRGRKKGKIAALLAALPLLMRGLKMAMAFRAAYASHVRLAPRGLPLARRATPPPR